MTVDSLAGCNAYTKANNPYVKTNNGKKVGAGVAAGIAGVDLFVASRLMKGAEKGAKSAMLLKSLPGTLKILAIGVGLGAIFDYVKNQTARQIADAK